jgi:hypothetical protein
MAYHWTHPRRRRNVATADAGSWKNLDRTFGVLLMLGAVGHTLGSFKTYGSQPIVLLWALCASVLVVLLGAINLLRVNRPADAALAWICVGAMVCWLACTLAFGHLLGNLFDFRIMIFAVLSIGLIFFGVRSAVRAREIVAL